MQRRTRVIAIVAAVFAALAIAAGLAGGRMKKSGEVLVDSGIRTGLQNNVLAWDETRGQLLTGAYNNRLMAWRDGKAAWSFDCKGSFVRLIVRGEAGVVYAASTDNHVYIVDLDSGEALGDFNAQRRIFDIDVNADASLLLVSAGVSTAKHNLMLFDLNTGEQVFNQQYRTQYKGCAFTADGGAMLLVNNRGELQKLDLEGSELAKVSANYEQVALASAGEGRHISLGTDGTYNLFDDDVNILLTGKIDLQQGDVPTAVGVSGDGSLVFVGTKERYAYAMNRSGETVYTVRLDNALSDFLAVGDDEYVTGLGDFLYVIDTTELTGKAGAQSLGSTLHRLTPALAAVALFMTLLAIPTTGRGLARFGRAVVKHRVASLLLMPTFALLILFNYTPTVMAFTRAFTNWSKTNFQLSQLRFVGFDNFRTMLQENYFLRGVKNLAIILACGFAKVLTVPLLLAWMVSMMQSGRKKYVYRFLLVLPIVVPGVVSALLWKQIYDPQIGLLNQLLGKLGLASLQRVWLGNEKTALGAIIFMGFPFVNAMAFLVYYGGFTNIDRSIFESARVDGASRGRIFWSIQLPMIGSQIKLMVILTFIGHVQEFYPIYLLTGGGPGTSTYVPGLELYLNATTFGRYGYACALGIVMFLFIMLGTLLNMRLQARAGKEGGR